MIYSKRPSFGTGRGHGEKPLEFTRIACAFYVIVKPETVVRWHRCGFRRYWAWKSRRRRPGRPGVAPEIRELIRNMSRANPVLCGASAIKCWWLPRNPLAC